MSAQFTIDPAVSKIRIAARTSAGPVVWVGSQITGSFEVACLDDGALDLAGPASGTVAVEIARLQSGNRVYDGELMRRINARRFPTATVGLISSRGLSASSVAAEASVSFHGANRSVDGELSLTRRDDGGVDVRGEQTIDIRDFGLPAPTMLMLKVYPDVRVALALVAYASDGAEETDRVER